MAFAFDLARVARAALFRYRLPLAAPLRLAGRTWTQREGLLLRLTDAEGRAGWGEAAPLPGFSRETRAEAEAALQAACDALNARRALNAGRALSAERALDVPAQPPSVRFAIVQAAAALRAHAAGRSLADVLAEATGAAPAATIHLNALVDGPPDAALDAARRLRAQGYRAVKLKVGRRPLADEAALVRDLARVLVPAAPDGDGDGSGGDGAALRLDANRAWTFGEAVTFADAVAGVPLDYVEEPLADAARLPDLAAATGWPLALDETTRETTPEVLAGRHAHAAAVVLKPTLLGLDAALQWARAARMQGMRPVVSAAYESGVGLRALVACAAAWAGGAEGGAVPVGLDTYRRLAADTLAPRLPLDAPAVAVADALGPAHAVDEAALTPLD